MSTKLSSRRTPIFTARSFVVSGSILVVSAIGVSAQSNQLQNQYHNVAVDFTLPASRKRDSRRERFQSLAQRWRRETEWLSSTTEIATHPDYQAIIGMGDDALPMILEDLRHNSGHWYWALKAISNEDPVPPSERGSIKKMRARWLEWGKTKGFVS